MSPLIERYWRPLLTYIIIPLAVLWILFLVVDLIVMPIFTRHGEEFPLPQVVGKSESEAQDILKQHDLSLQVAGREFSANRPEGVILSQLPEAGMPVKSGHSIKVVISAGVRISEVPDVVGLPLQQAILTLQKTGFAVGDIYYTRADTLPPDAVVETIPTRGTPLPLNSKVSLAVSQAGGGGTIPMPQLIGMPLERARAILDSLNLGISEITRVKDTLYLPQTVLDQIPTRNAPLMKGDMVRLTVSKTD
jgi:eukaryotic-like serine/threonine-protein kinase